METTVQNEFSYTTTAFYKVYIYVYRKFDKMANEQIYISNGNCSLFR